MGKDLKGKELGKGLVQEGTGNYLARFVNQYGKRQSKRFKKLQEARQWLADSTYLDHHSNIDVPNNMTVDSFFEFWVDTKSKMRGYGTAKTYKVRYTKSIHPIIGNMMITDVKAIHCQKIVNMLVDHNYCNSTIRLTVSILKGLFDYAVDCDIIMKTPCKIKISNNVGVVKDKKRALTIEEQKTFLEAIKGHKYENQFNFLIQTGLRIGEMIGLQWKDVDFKNKTITVRRSMQYHSETNKLVESKTKSAAGNRKIPLTDEALTILKNQKEMVSAIKIIPIEWRDFIFISGDGIPIQCVLYNNALKKICKKNKLRNFSVHILRHTYATRCIQAGMKPKTVQTLLGHSKYDTTMDMYVDTTEDDIFDEVKLLSNYIKAI